MCRTCGAQQPPTTQPAAEPPRTGTVCRLGGGCVPPNYAPVAQGGNSNAPARQQRTYAQPKGPAAACQWSKGRQLLRYPTKAIHAHSTPQGRRVCVATIAAAQRAVVYTSEDTSSSTRPNQPAMTQQLRLPHCAQAATVECAAAAKTTAGPGTTSAAAAAADLRRCSQDHCCCRRCAAALLPSLLTCASAEEATAATAAAAAATTAIAAAAAAAAIMAAAAAAAAAATAASLWCAQVCPVHPQAVQHAHVF